MNLNASHIQNINTYSPKRSRNAHDQDTNPSPSKKTRPTNAMGSSSDNIPASPSTNTSQRRVNETQNIEPLRAVTPDPFATPPSSPRQDRRAPSAPRSRQPLAPFTCLVNNIPVTFNSYDDLFSNTFLSFPGDIRKLPTQGNCCSVVIDLTNKFVYKRLNPDGRIKWSLINFFQFVTNEIKAANSIKEQLPTINVNLKKAGINISFNLPEVFQKHNDITIKTSFISGTTLDTISDPDLLPEEGWRTLIEAGTDILLHDDERAQDFFLNLAKNIKSFLHKVFPSSTLDISSIINSANLEQYISENGELHVQDPNVIQVHVQTFLSNHGIDNKAVCNNITAILYLACYLKQSNLIVDLNPENLVIPDSDS